MILQHINYKKKDPIPTLNEEILEFLLLNSKNHNISSKVIETLIPKYPETIIFYILKTINRLDLFQEDRIVFNIGGVHLQFQIQLVQLIEFSILFSHFIIVP